MDAASYPVHTGLSRAQCFQSNLIPAPAPIATGCLAASLARELSGATPRGGLGSSGICTLAALPGSTVLVLAASLAEAGASMSR